DLNDGSVIPGSEYWDDDNEWPTGDFGFVWGCYWGDDTSWKVQYLDLCCVQEGVIAREERFGYVRLASGRYSSPCLNAAAVDGGPSRPPDFIEVSREAGEIRVRFAVELDFELASGRVGAEQIGEIG